MKTNHIPMMGFQVSYKTLKYGFSEGNRRVPHRDELPAILETVNGDVFPTIHYYTKEPELLVPQLEALLRFGSIHDKGLVGGVQINKVWPTTKQISEIRGRFPQLKIILQMSSAVTGDMLPEQVAEKLARDYKGVEYIILDSSHGRGIEFEVAESVSTHNTFRALGVESRTTFSGGFSGENVREKVAALSTALLSLDFSIDAEGGLRDRVGEGYGNDVLNLSRVQRYLEGAREAFLLQERKS